MADAAATPLGAVRPAKPVLWAGWTLTGLVSLFLAMDSATQLADLAGG